MLFYFPFIPFLCAALHSLMVFSLCFGFLSALLCFFSLLSFIYLFLLSFEKFGMAVPCFLLSLNPLFCHHVAFYVFALSWYFFALPSSFCTFFPPLHFPFLLLSICFIVVFFFPFLLVLFLFHSSFFQVSFPCIALCSAALILYIFLFLSFCVPFLVPMPASFDFFTAPFALLSNAYFMFV